MYSYSVIVIVITAHDKKFPEKLADKFTWISKNIPKNLFDIRITISWIKTSKMRFDEKKRSRARIPMSVSEKVCKYRILYDAIRKLILLIANLTDAQTAQLECNYTL